MTINTKIYGC